jgi:excisionase family DNA binding protein
MQEKLYTEKEVAAYFGISVKTLQKYRQKRMGVEFVKIGRSVRYPFNNIQEYIKQNSVSPYRYT